MVQKLDESFFGNKPLAKLLGEELPYSLDLHYNKFEPSKEIDLPDTTICQYIQKSDIVLVFGVNNKEEKLVKYDFLRCTDFQVLIVHKRVLEKLEQMCPEDYQVIPIVIKNLKPKDEPFANKDFVLINVLHRVDAIDKDKTKITYYKSGIPYFSNITFRENCMEGHLLARERSSPLLLFDPKLAREFVNSKGVYFNDEEYLVA